MFCYIGSGYQRFRMTASFDEALSWLSEGADTWLAISLGGLLTPTSPYRDTALHRVLIGACAQHNMPRIIHARMPSESRRLYR